MSFDNRFSCYCIQPPNDRKTSFPPRDADNDVIKSLMPTTFVQPNNVSVSSGIQRSAFILMPMTLPAIGESVDLYHTSRYNNANIAIINNNHPNDHIHKSGFHCEEKITKFG